MTKLTWHDLQFALRRCPKPLLEVMKKPRWVGKVFIGGGFLRSIVAGETVNDIDVFVTSKDEAQRLAYELQANQRKSGKPFETDNAFTLTVFKPSIQIIHRWVFDSAAAVSDSFDFTCCCAAFWWEQSATAPEKNSGWRSTCDERFYPDVAAKRLIYRNPVRNEDAGGSMLRVLKYYQKGYRIPLDSLANVITRLIQGVALDKFIGSKDGEERVTDPAGFSKIVTALLREVDPAIDPSHVAHLPAEDSREENA